tara:strand:+ start:749 stop:1093 length:345 start_codon:yes stop_codon:yes gene_type:complete
MKKVIKITESDLERLVKRILKEEDNFDPIENALERMKGEPKAYPIEDIAKKLSTGTYEILGLSPFQTLKGYRIKQINDSNWGLYDKRVRDHKVAQLFINLHGEVVDFKMNPNKI